MKLWDLIKPKKDVFQNYADNMKPLQPIQEIPLIQVAPNAEGGVDAQVTQWQPRPTRTQNFKNKLGDFLFGQRQQPTDSIGTYDGLPVTRKDELTGEDITYTPERTSTISENPRVGGLFRDFGAGARENFNTGFAADNLLDSYTNDGRPKGLAYRLGEGFGSIGRLLESPFGRGLLTAAAVKMAGGNNADMLAYGLQGGSLNQQLRNADKLYRQQLKDNYGFTDEQLGGTRGYIRPDTFNNLTKSQNSAMNLALRQQTTQSMNRLRELQAEKLRIQNSTLPEMEKARLKKAIAEAEYAEEMQLAKIRAYSNSAALGWSNFGLKADMFDYKKNQDAKKEAEEAGIGTPSPFNSKPATPPAPKNENGGWAF